jgi:hypothetical protein
MPARSTIIGLFWNRLPLGAYFTAVKTDLRGMRPVASSKTQPAIHLLVEVEVKRVQDLAAIAKAGLRDAALEEPVLAAQGLVLDERGKEVDRGRRRGLGLEQPRLEPGGDAGAAEQAEGVLQLDEVHVGRSSWVLGAITSR